MSVTLNNDLVVGYNSIEKAQEIAELCYITIQVEDNEPFSIPCAPLVPDGTVNYKSYLVRTRMVPGVGQDQMVQCLIAEGYRIRDIQMDNVENGAKSYDIQIGGFTAWLEFGSIEEAFGMKDTF